MATTHKRRAPPMEEGYYIRSLSMPMRLSASGELCSGTSIATGATITIGRSKKLCDVTFEDARVSRKHCQLRLLPHSNSLILLNGATTISLGASTSQCVEEFECADANRCILLSQKRTGNIEPHSQQNPKSLSRYLSRSPKKQLGVRIRNNVANKKDLKHPEEHISIIRDHGENDKEGLHNDEAGMFSGSMLCCNAVSDLWKPSLNGIFVNGHAFKEKMVILMPGDEVSLVGPTEGGKSLDIDCPTAVGFVVEMQPAMKKAPCFSKCLSVESCTKHTEGDNFSAPIMLNKGVLSGLHELGILVPERCTRVDSRSSAQLDTSSNNLLCHDQAKHAHSLMGTIFDAKSLGGSDSNPSLRVTSTSYSKSSGLEDAIEGRKWSPVKTDKSESSKRYQVAQLKQRSCSIDLDSKFRSIFNLVKASVQLRFDLLNGFTNEHSHGVAGLKEPLLANAKEKFHFGRDGNQKCMVHSNPLLEYTMPNRNAVEDASNILRESQKGDNAFEIHESCTFEDTIKVDTSPSRQVNLLDDVGAAVDENSVILPGSSILFCKEGSSSKGLFTRDQRSKDLESSVSHRMGTVLVSQTDLPSDTLENACSKLKVFDCLQGLANSGDFAQEVISGKSSKEAHTEVQLVAEKKVMNGDGEELLEIGKLLEAAHCNEALQFMFETQTGDLRDATESVSGFQGKEELSKEQSRSKKEDINYLQPAVEGCSIGGPIQGHVVKDSACNSEGKESWDFQLSKKVPTHTLEVEVVSSLSSCRAGAEASKLLIMNEECVNRDHNLSVTLIESGIQNEVLQEMAHKELRVFNLGDTSFVQGKSPSAVQNLDPLKMASTMRWSQPLGASIFTSGLPAAGVFHLGSTIVKDGELCKEKDLQSMSETFFEFSAALHHSKGAKQTTSTCLKQVCNDLMEDNAATELALEQSKSFNRHGSICTQKPIPDVCFDQVCEDSKEGNAATDGAMEQSHSFHRCGATYAHDSCLRPVCDIFREGDTAVEVVLEHSRSSDKCTPSCTQSLTVKAQGEDRVEKLVANEKIHNIDAAGYYLNRLQDSNSGVPIDYNSAVCLWDLLALNNDVQALFIATFTYDLEWFLSAAGLSCDIPVTVACHNAKYCWSMASKDRCEKPYLDWPNVTLVYPPFPRSNAFGKSQGIGCHHPKIFLLRRTGSLRVIVSSANLTFKQWFHVTNNVWWQDFPCRQTPDFRCLFQGEEKHNSTATPDFAAQLAIFLAALLADVPSEAHWVTDLATYDFSDAAGSLVASVPGLHQPLYQNAPQFLATLNTHAYSPSLPGNDFMSYHLGVVPTTVAGIKYRFSAAADRNGTRIRSLAAVLSDFTALEIATMPVLLKRAKFLKADPNAVSVIVTSQANGCSQDLFLQEDLHDAEINTMESDTLQTENGFIKLGFLPRDVARWLAVLCDRGFFSFAACIWPNEALAVASGQCERAVKLALYVFQGPKFSTLSPSLMTSEERGAFSGLIKSLHNAWGLWRLEKVLSKYNWIDSQEKDFYVASSSIGTSLDAKFLAAFAAAAGRRAESMMISQDSDPQWGCWTAEQEAANPSIGIVFPSIDRVRRENFLHYGLLCFAESAWLRLKSANLLHDAVPYPPEREGFPMHIKVARRRFQESWSSRPYGWMYCGSHNFSPAAWGRPIWRSGDWEAATDAGSILGSSLHICNYELGIVLIEPPPDEDHSKGKNESNRLGLDRYVLPFKVPPPIYTENDRPATGKAMAEAYMEMRALQLKAAAEEDLAVLQSEDLVEEANNVQQEDAAGNANREEARAEQVYVQALWSQIDEEEKTDEDGVDESK